MKVKKASGGLWMGKTPAPGEVQSDSYDSAAQVDQQQSGGNNSAKEADKAKHAGKHHKKKKHKKNSFSFLFPNLSDSYASTGNGNRSYLGGRSKTSVSAAPPTVEHKEKAAETEERTDEEDEAEDEDEVDAVDSAVPRLPRGKKMVDTIVARDVDSLFKSVFENDFFFEIVGSKAYEEFRNFECTEWTETRSSGGLREREMRYEISKNIALSRQNVFVEQRQVQLGYSRRHAVYAVDTVTQNAGVVYSDYFKLNIHYRFTAVDASHSRLAVVADIEFVKPCLFKGRIEAEAWSGMKKYYDVLDAEVQPEKGEADEGGEDEAAAAGLDSKQRKELQNMRTAMSNRLYGTLPTAVAPSGLNISQDIVVAAFFLLILTMIMITLAMFKLNSAIGSLEERLYRLEQVAARNGRLFEMILNSVREEHEDNNGATLPDMVAF